MTEQPMRGKADIHLHTTYSDGLMTPEALVEYAATHTDLNVIAVTDHDNIEGGLVARAYAERFADDLGGLEVIAGVEVTSAEADIVGLFMKHDVPKGLSAAETIERIHDQGGLALAVHPYAMALESMGLGGMRGAKDLIQTLPFDAVETRNATPTEFFTNRDTRRANQSAQKLPETGGSDSHYIGTVGRAYTRFPGTTAAQLRHAIQRGHVTAGGSVYSPLILFNIAWDLFARKLPAQALPAERAALWKRPFHSPVNARGPFGLRVG